MDANLTSVLTWAKDVLVAIGPTTLGIVLAVAVVWYFINHWK